MPLPPSRASVDAFVASVAVAALPVVEPEEPVTLIPQVPEAFVPVVEGAPTSLYV